MLFQLYQLGYQSRATMVRAANSVGERSFGRIGNQQVHNGEAEGRRLDIVDHTTRSRMMAGIRHKDTLPERQVRSLLHRMGYRYRLHAKGIPGKPDIAFAARRQAIFVHGCFWHRHAGCRYAYTPKTRTDWWRAKLDANQARDQRVLHELSEKGWSALVVWECDCRDPAKLGESLTRFLGAPRKSARARGKECR